MTAHSRTLVLIDPTSPDGENGLDLVDDAERSFTVLLLLGDPSALAVQQFADAENISIGTAASFYLDQVTERVGNGHVVDAVSTSNADAVSEILHTVASRGATRVVVPPSLPGLRGAAFAHLARVCPVPVIVAPARAAA